MMMLLLNQLYPCRLQIAVPEIALLLLASQYQPSADQQTQIASLINAVTDWDAFVDLAVEHRVYPLVFWNLRAFTVNGQIPSTAAKPLQEAFSQNLFSCIRMEREFVRVMTALEQNGIAALTMRGPVLGQMLYGQSWIRDAKDLDLLVDKPQYAAAETTLLALGYKREVEIEDNAYNQRLFNAETGIQIELHWALDSPFMPVEVTWQTVWERAQPETFEGVAIRAFSDLDLLMMLCFHGAKHRWSRLKWLCDVAEFIRLRPAFDWDAALQTARAMRIERIFLVTLAMTRDLFGTALPPHIEQIINRHPIVKHLARYIKYWIFNQGERHAIEQIRGIAFFLLAREHNRDRYPSIQHALRHPKSPLIRKLLRRTTA
ncbi:MAG: hypothetical protein CUN53_01535 [Phototrophicales bacterium]|nr:MAG: hypothetical protein CUN53_01535 [Phototrophicales bacterium]